MKSQNASAFTISLGLHVIVIIALALIKYQIDGGDIKMVLDSVFSEERVQEDFEQEVDLRTDPAETMNLIAGAVAENAAAVDGGAGVAAAQEKIDTSESLKEPDIQVNVGAVTMPGLDIIASDLGPGQVSGEVGRVVEGYGAALGQITQELIRLMREEKVLAVWLFDASESMEDDIREVRDNFHKVYEELGIATRQDDKIKNVQDPILTSICTFNTNAVELTAKPTSDLKLIRAAIDKIKKDDSGDENFCRAVYQVIDKYGRMAKTQQRKLVIIMASDESGDDGDKIEEAIEACKKSNTSVYFLGRYSVFGFPYARMKWVDPVYKLTHWLRINRGPETPFPECLQFDGLHERWDVYSSGFGPYEQVRLCRETGGVFFLLPGDETNITGRGSHEDRKYELLDMREYLPDLSARLPYAKERDSSKFRGTIFQVIQRLNPFQDDKLKMREHWFPADHVEFAKEGKSNFDKAVYALKLLNDAIVLLETVKPQYDREQSMRWRAHYDLMHAQMLAYRVRLFQYILTLDKHQADKPMPKDPKNNVWNIQRVTQMQEPTPTQVKLAKVDMDELKKQEQMARDEFKQVIEKHPRTPWAKLAEHELRQGFGMKLVETFRDPNYANIGKDIKLPKP